MNTIIHQSHATDETLLVGCRSSLTAADRQTLERWADRLPLGDATVGQRSIEIQSENLDGTFANVEITPIYFMQARVANAFIAAFPHLLHPDWADGVFAADPLEPKTALTTEGL